MNTNVSKQLDDLFRVWDNGLCPGAQVLIRQHGETVYEKCFGYGNPVSYTHLTLPTICSV